MATHRPAPQQWATYVNTVTDGLTNQEVSDRTAQYGEKPVSESTIRGWRNATSGNPTWGAVKQFAEAFSLPLAEAYLHAGILTERDLGHSDDGTVIVINEPTSSLEEASTTELWIEMGRRIGTTEGEVQQLTHPPATARERRKRRRLEYDPGAPPP